MFNTISTNVMLRKRRICHDEIHGNDNEKHEEDDELRVSDLRIPVYHLWSGAFTYNQLCHVYGTKPGGSS